jgi:hypothetical protein
MDGELSRLLYDWTPADIVCGADATNLTLGSRGPKLV